MPKIDKNAVVAVSKPAVGIEVSQEARALVGGFTSPLPDVAPDRVNTLYFYSGMSKHAGVMRDHIAGITDNAPVLYTADDEGYYAAENLYLLRADLYFTEMDDQGNLIAVSREEVGKCFEDFQAIVLVDLGDELIPARASFRRTRAAAARAMVRSLKKADPTGTNPLAWAAFKGRLRVHRKTRTNGGKGTYPVVDVDIFPTGEPEKKLIESAFSEPAFVTSLKQVRDAYESRLKFLESKLA